MVDYKEQQTYHLLPTIHLSCCTVVMKLVLLVLLLQSNLHLSNYTSEEQQLAAKFEPSARGRNNVTVVNYSQSFCGAMADDHRLAFTLLPQSQSTGGKMPRASLSCLQQLH
jgi:hypothetical protein